MAEPEGERATPPPAEQPTKEYPMTRKSKTTATAVFTEDQAQGSTPETGTALDRFKAIHGYDSTEVMQAPPKDFVVESTVPAFSEDQPDTAPVVDPPVTAIKEPRVLADAKISIALSSLVKSDLETFAKSHGRAVSEVARVAIECYLMGQKSLEAKNAAMLATT